MQNVTYWDWPTIIFYYGVMLVSMLLASALEHRKCKIVFGNVSLCDMETTNKRGRPYTGIGLFLVSVIWLVILAIRDMTRGTDIYGYFRIYSLTSLSDIKSAFQNAINREPVWSIFEMILRHFNVEVAKQPGTMIYLGISAAIWIIFVRKALENELKGAGIGLSVGWCYCLFFFRSFSMLRQSCAIAMIMYAYTMLAKGDKKKYWILQVLAVGFHYSAIFAVLGYFFWDEEIGTTKTGSLLKKLLVLLAIMGLIVYGESFFGSLFGATGSKYDNALVGRASSFGIGQLAMRLPLLTFVWLYRDQIIEENPHNAGYISLLVFDLFVSQLNYVSPSFNRASLYFNCMYVFIIPPLIRAIGRGRLNDLSQKLIGLIIVTVYFFSQMNYYIYSNPYYISPYITGV